MSATCLDSRRLTGPNLIWDHPGAVIDVRFGDTDPDTVIAEWQRQVRRVLHAVGWDGEQTCVRRFAEGASLAISAPIDALYAATDLNDWAWAATEAVISGNPVPDLETDLATLHETIEAERNRGLQALLQAAESHQVPLLHDEDEVSIGLGRHARCWPAGELPAPDGIDWSVLGTIPVGLVTGTNGKTTTVRLVSAMARAAGRNVGISSTDWIGVNEEIIERGDFSGPSGARTVLRDPRVDIAVLETARGGLLRRGLAVTRADAALITNIAEDHLGEFALHDVEELADIKWVVTRTLAGGGQLILNADDALLAARAEHYDGAITWFSRDSANPLLENADTLCTVEQDRLVAYTDDTRHDLLAINDIPVTLEGAASHNVSNALGATALAYALGLPFDAIAAGLRNTRDTDNPGRCNLYRVNGARVLVDFAHNPHGVQALFELADRLPAKRKLLVIGQAGDRSDDAITKLAQAAWALQPTRIIIKEMASLARGREHGEVAAMLRKAFLHLGARTEAIGYQEQEFDAVREALDWGREDDLLILLVHEDRPAVTEYIQGRSDGGS